MNQTTNHAIFEKKFHYEMECQRYDAPRDNMSKWLEDQAVEIANRKTRGDWVVYQTALERKEDETHVYTVKMKPRFS